MNYEAREERCMPEKGGRGREGRGGARKTNRKGKEQTTENNEIKE